MLSVLKTELKSVIDNYGIYSNSDKNDILLYLLGDLSENFDGFTPDQIREWFVTIKEAFVGNAEVWEAYFRLLRDCAIPITRSALCHLHTKEQIDALISSVKVSKLDFDHILSANFDVDVFQDSSLSKMYQLMKNHKRYVDLAHERNVW